MITRTEFLAAAGAMALAALSRSRGVPCSGSDCPIDQVAQLPRAGELPVRAKTGVVLELPPEVRTRNWGGGSCVHASNVNLLKQMGQHELAEWWRRNYSGGEYDTRLVSRLEAAGLRYAYISDRSGRDSDGDGTNDGEEFLFWCQRTGRGAGIFYKPSHSINFAGQDEQYVYLLDNNATTYPERVGYYERAGHADFFRRWRGFGGFAWTLIYDPIPGPLELP
jgi:hypothetical protein